MSGSFAGRLESVYPRRVSSTVRAVVLGLVLGAVGVGLLVSRGFSRAAEDLSAHAKAHPKSAYETRMLELCRLNANLPSEPELEAEYQSINANYFQGRLPQVRIRWEPRLDDLGPLIADGFRLEGATDGKVVLLHPALQGDDPQRKRALCHEMVHVSLRGEPAGHGPEFQRRLRQLVTDGAFTGIVATEDEKQDLRRTVDARTRELEQTSTSLRHTSAELNADDARLQRDVEDLNARTAAANQRQSGWPPDSEREAMDARRRDLQSRAADFNQRVLQHNRAVAELNRLSEQYNLMVSYPDGLDRERVQRRDTMDGGR